MEIGERQLETGGVYVVKPLAVLAMVDEGELDWKVRRGLTVAVCTSISAPHPPCAASATQLARMPCAWLLPAVRARRLQTFSVALQVIAIRADNPRAGDLEDVEDVERCAEPCHLVPASLVLCVGSVDAKRCFVQGREMPGLIERIRVWFRDYKTPDGKLQNSFAFDNIALNKEYTTQVWPLPGLCLHHMSVASASRLCLALKDAGPHHKPGAPVQVLAERHGFYSALEASKVGSGLSLV